MADDGLDTFYADRLWNLLPRFYRTSDSPDGTDTPGPLRELVGRLGSGIAASRRSVDALGRLGSIETADDWATAYFAELLATRLVGSMDARAQRLDVARTIYYRRRAGTLGLIELLASDVTGHDARGVEFFRRLGRTRHQFDPPIGGDATLAGSELLIGAFSGTPAGGTADLRKAWGASATNGPFDEFAHTADFRRPGQTAGHFAIPRVGIFVWWLYAYAIEDATPVQRQGCPNEFTFDPTGRDIPLYGAGGRTRETLGENWTSPEPWELPIAISNLLFAEDAGQFYPAALSVDLAGGGTPAPDTLADLAIDTELGRFRFPKGAPVGEFLSTYRHALAGPVGAQGQPDTLPAMPDEPAAATIISGGTLGTALDSPVDARTVIFDDSRTYNGFAGPIAIGPGGTLVLRATSQRRPLLRWTTPGTEVVIDGGDSDARLVLRGLHWQGADLRLTGKFASVSIELATLDPGSLDGGAIGSAIDGLALNPAKLIVEADVSVLTVSRSITGPIVTAGAGVIETLIVADSIIQAIVPAQQALLTTSGRIELLRTTVLGPAQVHRISASSTLFDDVVLVDDAQHGCIRFSTYAVGSGLHEPYRSVAIPRRSAILHSRRFGDPGYARVSAEADRVIASPGAGTSIWTGAENGAETGAFSSERVALKARSLSIKLEEFMPIGTFPVLIDANV